MVDFRRYIKFLNTVKKLVTICWLLLSLTHHYYVIITAQYLHSCGYSVACKHPEHTQTTGRHVRSDEDGSFAATKLCKTHTEKCRGVSVEAKARDFRRAYSRRCTCQHPVSLRLALVPMNTHGGPPNRETSKSSKCTGAPLYFWGRMPATK